MNMDALLESNVEKNQKITESRIIFQCFGQQIYHDFFYGIGSRLDQDSS